MLTKLFWLSSLAALSWAECIQVGPIPRGTVDIMTFDLTGAIIGPTHAELTEVETRKVVQRTSNGKFNRVPFGEYSIRAWRDGFVSATREIRLEQKSLTVRLQLDIGLECYSFSSLSGTVSSKVGNHELWVKSVPLRGSEGTESRIEPSGRFFLGGLTAGDYVVVVLDGSAVIYTEVVKVIGQTNREISLPFR